jgi:hypothetical protein
MKTRKQRKGNKHSERIVIGARTKTSWVLALWLESKKNVAMMEKEANPHSQIRFLPCKDHNSTVEKKYQAK